MCQLDSIFGLLTILGVVVLSLAMDGLARLACDEQLLCGRYKTVVDIASTVPNPSPLGGFPSLSSDQETDCTSINPPMSDPARLKAATAYGLTAAIGLSNAICDPPYDISIDLMSVPGAWAVVLAEIEAHVRLCLTRRLKITRCPDRDAVVSPCVRWVPRRSGPASTGHTACIGTDVRRASPFKVHTPTLAAG